MLSADFNEMLSSLDAENAEYLVVDAYALAAHGIPRATGDLDIWIRRNSENAARVWRALASFGAPLEGISPADLTAQDNVIQIGVAPNRIDLMTTIDGVEFDDAWPDRMVVNVGGQDVPFLGREHFIRNKRTTGRDQDLADVARLIGRAG